MSDQNEFEFENPFQQLSNIFIENQRTFNIKINDIRQRLERISEKSKVLSVQLVYDPFKAQLNLLLNFEEEARLCLNVAKELEKQRDDIMRTISTLKETKEVKLNK